MRHSTCRLTQPSTLIASNNHNTGQIFRNKQRKASTTTFDIYMDDDSENDDAEIMQSTGKSRKNQGAYEDELSSPKYKKTVETRATLSEGLMQNTSDDKIDQEETENGNDMEYNEAEGHGRRRYDLRTRTGNGNGADVSKLRGRILRTKVGRDAYRGGSSVHKCHGVIRRTDDSLVLEKDQGPAAIPLGRGSGALQVDESVSFDDVGGLSKHIDALKEMVFLPLLCPHFFTSHNITPPRGVLLCGPPGTGKTLIVRALASALSKEGQKVSFYMRKGADVLSKWVGEAERQLKLVFGEARKNQPAIIFFDEIDGLAPVRTSKQEQNHNSIVSTLLALMDGLDSRGQVVLIGATNRIDAIDGALRRPGRFDREFNFSLPGYEARAEILDIHTRKWKISPSKELKLELAATCVGYCGADLKALCTEAAIFAFREKYPQVYTNDNLFEVDVDSVNVEKYHFVEAMSKITPAAHRGAVVHSRPMSMVVSSCLQRHLIKVMSYISDILPPLAVSSQLTNLAMRSSASQIPLGGYRPRLLLCGDEGSGLDHLGPAILHELEKFPVHSLGLPSLLSDPSAMTPEQALVQIFGEAKRTTPSILYLPHLNLWWKTAHEQLQAVFVMLLDELPSHLPILLLATSSVPPAEVDVTISSIFSDQSVFQLGKPSTEDRFLFFGRLIEDALSVSLMGITKNSEELGVSSFPSMPVVQLGTMATSAPLRNIQLEVNLDQSYEALIQLNKNVEAGHAAPEINDPNPELPEYTTACGNQLGISGEVSGHEVIGSQDIIMSDGEMTNQTDFVKQRFVERTENYGIRQLEALYTIVKKCIFDIKLKGNIDGSQPSILSYLLKFADDAANF